ncbi:acid-sensing ion channel 3-like [Asterias rubens]|uniref:acid-sensing ion channel 3-like n=1 Tax=Asterias rubens TaxID=7604 RepID=UPI001455D6B4|nr:acid-sensing ion channel 3-like [Asterias rubens]
MDVWRENVSNAMPLEDKRPIVTPTQDYPVRTTFIDMGRSDVKEKRRCRFSEGLQGDFNDDRTFADRFREFGRNTTFHGLGYVTNNKYNYMRRLGWSAVVLTVSGVLISQIVTLILHFYTYPMTSTISINYVETMTFPAVTLCNFNQFKKSKFNQMDLDFMKKLYGPLGRDVDSNDFDSISINESAFEDDDDVITWLLSASHTLEDMLIDCKWRSSHNCTAKNFTRRFTDHGVCFTFNEPANKAEPLSVRNAGSRDGLYMRLYAEHDEYTFGESTAAGFRVLLHPQGVLPLVQELGFSLSPGFESSVAVRQNKIKTLKEPFKSNCTESRLGHSEVYTVPTCRFECKVKFAVERCGCRDYRWPGNEPICDPEKQIRCIYPKEEEFQNTDVECDCPDSCSLTTYESRISMGYWPADHISNFHSTRENISVSNIRKNYLDVYIFFEELMYIQIEQTEAFSSSSLQSNIGGYMGLFCGMSIITVIEWLDFLSVTLIRKFRHKKD